MKPLWLLLIPFFIGFICYAARKKAQETRFRRTLGIAIRSAVCVLLVLAMAMPGITASSDVTATIFALDRSASVARADGTTFLEEAKQAQGENDSVGLICFGRSAGVEMLPSQDNTLPSSDFLTYVDTEGTNIAAALALAGGIFPADAAKRLVLLTDGEETAGDALRQAAALHAQGVTVDVFSLEQDEPAEVQATALELPQVIHRNMEYEIALRVDANVDTSVQVRLYKGNTLIGEETVAISAGENRIVFSDITEQGGSVVYRGEITPERDTISRNNKVYGYTFIEDVPRVLLLGDAVARNGWAALLSSAQLQVDAMAAGAAPTALERLQGYDCVVLANVAAQMLPEGFLELLEVYVRTLGGGVIASGGEESYALGGYFNTILEEILPVDMELKTEGEEPDLAMVMLIDRSGSMSSGVYGVSLLEMAKEAAIRSLDGFQEKDQLGIIAFDDGFSWAVPMTKIGGNKADIENKIGKLQIGGGTSILPGLTEAVQTLAQTTAKEKHIILLTDGQAEQTGYTSVLNHMQSAGITLSSVAVGAGADAKLLQSLAESGNGRYYYTDEFTDLPSIFAKETLLAGKEYLNNRSFYPQQRDASAILADITEVPRLSGYIGTTAKPRADVVLQSDTEEPILAAWQYGLGRSVAWTADVGGSWTREWLAADSGAAVLRNTVGWVLNTQLAQDMQLTATAGSETSTLRLEMPFDATLDSISATVLLSDGTPHTLDFTALAPGVYEGLLQTAAEGAYVASLMLTRMDGSTEYYNTGFTLPYAAEYDMTLRGGGETLLQQIAAAGGGRVLHSGSEVFAADAIPATTHMDLTMLCMALGLLLFLLDIALRRFAFLPAALERKYNMFFEKRRKREKKAERVQPSSKKMENAADVPQKEKPRTAENAAETKSTAQKLAEARKKRGN